VRDAAHLPFPPSHQCGELQQGEWLHLRATHRQGKEVSLRVDLRPGGGAACEPVSGDECLFRVQAREVGLHTFEVLVNGTQVRRQRRDLLL
jgi:hypothetical protein